jgi:hypothetical protein
VDPLDAVVAEPGPAPERLRRWLDQLISAKRRRALDDPELFASYVALAAEAREVIHAHVNHLAAQAGQIIADGVARGELTAADPTVAGRAVLDATARFHDPAHVAQWADPSIDAALEGVWVLILGGLGAHPQR